MNKPRCNLKARKFRLLTIYFLVVTVARNQAFFRENRLINCFLLSFYKLPKDSRNYNQKRHLTHQDFLGNKCEYQCNSLCADKATLTLLYSVSSLLKRRQEAGQGDMQKPIY